MGWAIYGMVYLGSALMVYNIWGFLRYTRSVQAVGGGKNPYMHLAVALLIMFLLGYLAVGIFGHPDLIVSGILFGGSIFVFIMYRMINSITRHIIENMELRAELLAAEESNKSKTEFLASVSHEMRTPLNVIMGLDTVALREHDLRPETRDCLEKIKASAGHLLDLINDVLDMNSLENDSLVIKEEPFRMREPLTQLNAIFGAMCDEKGLTYECQAREECLDQGLIGDEAQLKHVLFSLLDNAVKYTDAPGRVGLSLECKPKPDGTDREAKEEKIVELCFKVSDTGVGIDEEFLPKVFDVFAREDARSTSNYGGTGLGLAVTKKLVERRGGRIEVSSQKNVGSVFTVILPMKLDPEQDRPQEPSAEAEEVSLEGRRFLIVEDIPENAEIVEDLLDLEGADSEHAENGKIGVDMFRSKPPGYYDAVLMDLRMPVMDGLTATREIRATDREDAGEIPIIALTANAFASDIKQSLDAGMNAHLGKPADADQLYDTLKHFIR